jgi:pimeloyl-ACP methyl ester carboxylesterase
MQSLSVAECYGPGRDPEFPIPQYATSIRGLRTVFFDSGGDKPALLFIHGLAGNGTHWIHIAPKLQDRYRVIGLDLPGCGSSASPTDRMSVAFYVEHVRELLELLDVQTAGFIGHSLGGMISTEFALRYPKLCNHIILVSPAGFLTMPAPIRLLGHLFLRPALLNPILPRAWRQLLAFAFGRSNEYTKRFIQVQAASEETGEVAKIIGGVSRVMYDLKPDFLTKCFLENLDQIKQPVAMIWGDQDRLVATRGMRKAAAVMPGARLRELNQCGHLPLIELPNEIISFVEEALGVAVPAPSST